MYNQILTVQSASVDLHATLTKEFFNYDLWEKECGGWREDASWNQLRKVSDRIKPTTRGPVPEHYAPIRNYITKTWPEPFNGPKSFETRRSVPPWGGDELVYNTNK
jgi:hypothetical protein